MVEQVAQAFRNVATVSGAASAEHLHMMLLRIQVTDGQAYLSNLQKIGKAFREVSGGYLPAMTFFLVVAGLFVPEALVEIDGMTALRWRSGKVLFLWAGHVTSVAGR
jgi:hypothetical protein